MNEMFREFEFNKATKYTIKEINGVQLPKDYIDFMSEHNGGGMLLGYDSKKELYYAVDSCSMDEDDMFYEADSLESFINTMERELA